MILLDHGFKFSFVWTVQGKQSSYKEEETSKFATTDTGHGQIPFRRSNLFSRLCRCSSSSTPLSRSVFSVWVKISFMILRQSIPRRPLLSSSFNNDRTSWMLACLSSVIFPQQIETSRSRSFISSSSRIICSSKLLYSVFLYSNFSTSSKKAHSLTPFNMAFNTDRRSELRNPFSSNSSNNENVGMFSSPRRAASFPLHITSNCLPTFMLSSLWLISNSKLLYSYSDISKQRLHLFHQVFPLSSHPYHSYRSERYS